MTLYNTNGQIRLTSVPGTSLTGLYAADGSYNIVLNTNTTQWLGLQHPCGAYNAVVVTNPISFYNANGSLNVIQNSDTSYSSAFPAGFSSSTPPPPSPLAINFLPAGAINTPNISAGSQTALQWERTQPWTMNCLVQCPGPPTVVASGGGTAAIIFTTCNQGSGSIFAGYEAWINSTGTIQVRVINNVGTSNYIGVFGAINVCDNAVHNIGVSYDGSSTVAGIKIYVDGVLDTNTSEGFALSASIINTQPFVIGNQLGFPFPLGGSLKNFQLSNIVRNQAYCAAYSTIAVDANVVLAYPFTEGTGTTTADSSSNGFTGTFNSAQWPYVGLPSLTVTDNAQSANAASTYTFGSRNFGIGPAATSRQVVAVVHGRIGANTTAVVSSVTIGGISATLITDSRNTTGGALSTTSVWQAAVPTGTTATISVVFSATMARAGIEVFSVVGANASLPTGGAVANYTSATAVATATGSITIPTSGVALIAGSLSAVTGNPGITPTNYIGHGGPVNLASTMWYVSGYDNTVGARSYTLTWTGTSPANTTGVFVAWGL